MLHGYPSAGLRFQSTNLFLSVLLINLRRGELQPQQYLCLASNQKVCHKK